MTSNESSDTCDREKERPMYPNKNDVTCTHFRNEALQMFSQLHFHFFLDKPTSFSCVDARRLPNLMGQNINPISLQIWFSPAYKFDLALRLNGPPTLLDPTQRRDDMVMELEMRVWEMKLWKVDQSNLSETKKTQIGEPRVTLDAPLQPYHAGQPPPRRRRAQEVRRSASSSSQQAVTEHIYIRVPHLLISIS